MADPKLLCLTRCHRRAGRLMRALWQICHDLPAKGIDTRVVLAPDRPTPEVEWAVQDWRNEPRVLDVVTPPVPVLSPQTGQNWMPVLNSMLEAADRRWSPEWLIHWNSDWLLGPGWEETLRTLLDSPGDVLAYDAVSLFFHSVQDGDIQVNANQRHLSPLFGRYRTGWRHREDMDLQVVEPVFDRLCDKTKQLLPFFLIDIGTISDGERRRLFKHQARCGKLDDYTRRMVAPPRLVPLQEALNMGTHKFYRYQLGLK